MSPNSKDFSLYALEARFEMQRFYFDEPISGESGSDHGYYGGSWDNLGNGNGYVGDYQVASDNSGAMLDDGTYTDGSAGAFPAYNNGNPAVCLVDPNFPGCPQQQNTSRCTICRC